jgi:hypothetical protein
MGYLLAGPLLSLAVIMAAAVLSMVVAMSRAGYPVEFPQVATFVATLTIGFGLLIWYLESLGRSVRATREEQTRPLPGDDLIPSPIGSFTHAVTVASPPHDVWPWIAQMGAGSRAGWYSYDLLDNGRKPSADRIHEELQELKTGMVFPAMPGVTDGFTLVGF